LALAGISLGSFLALAADSFNWLILWLSLATAFLLQILSNLANDYGDTEHGADNDHRVGPVRAVQSGKISGPVMRSALFILIALCLAVGYFLIRGESFFYYILGLAAIGAALAYTVGPRPYGYAGLGDIFVFLFFGPVAVNGTYYLHTHLFDFLVFLPAFSCGLFCVAVLNVNNLRDIESDRLAGKNTIPVRVGVAWARKYHWILLIAGTASAIFFVVINYRSPWQLLFLITLPFFWKNGLNVSRQNDSAKLDPYLKQLALSTLLFCFSFGVGSIL